MFSQAFLRTSGAVGDSKGEHPLAKLELAEKVNYAVFFFVKWSTDNGSPRSFSLASVGGMTALHEKNIRCQEALFNS